MVISSIAPHNFAVSKTTESNENFGESSCKGIFVVGKVGPPHVNTQLEYGYGIWQEVYFSLVKMDTTLFIWVPVSNEVGCVQ